MVDSTLTEFLLFLRTNMQIQEEPTRLMLLLPTGAFVIAVWSLTSAINFYKKDILNQYQLQPKEQLLKLLRNGYRKISFLSILSACLAGPVFLYLVLMLTSQANGSKGFHQLG